MKAVLAMFVVFVAVVSTGCSSIVSKSEYTVAVNSSPDGSNFVITDKNGQKVHSGVTPASVTLKSSSGYFSGQTYTITFQKEGYAEKVFTVQSSLDGWYIGNVVFGGLIGMLIVDPATGAMYNLPKRVDVSLDETTAQTGNETLTIATIDSLSSEQLAKLEKIN